MEIYVTGREMTRPYTSGKMMGDFTIEELRCLSAELTEEEKTSPFASHYYEKMADLAPEHIAAFENGPLRPDQCMMPDKLGEVLLDRLDEDGTYPPVGYGVLENGIGYAAMKIDQPGITDEMIVKYREEFAHEEDKRNLFYKIWFPGKHYMHFEDAVLEDFGWGPVLGEWNWERFRFTHVGITPEDIAAKDPTCISLLGICGDSYELEKTKEEAWPLCMIMHTRLTDNGREVRIHYWKGLRLNFDGTFSVEAAADRQDTENKMRMMMDHCLREYCNELRLMKNFWNEK